MYSIDLCPPNHLPFVQLSTQSTGLLLWHKRGKNTEAVIAHENGRPIGIASYKTYQRRGKKTVHLRIIWTARSARGCGLSKQVFSVLIDAEAPDRVRAEAITKRGSAFFTWAQSEYPDVEFRVKKCWGQKKKNGKKR